MNVVQTRELPLMGFSQEGAPDARVRGTFPLHYDTGCASTAVVYFELDPGDRLPRHTDSAEELLVVLDGQAEAIVGEERGRAEAGAIIVVPAMVPHEVRNVGNRTLRVAGCFSSNTVVSVFDEPFAETGGRVLGTPPPTSAAAPM